MKFFVRQVEPEIQASHFCEEFDEFYAENLIIWGNPDYIGLIDPDYKRVLDIVNSGELSAELEESLENRSIEELAEIIDRYLCELNDIFGEPEADDYYKRIIFALTGKNQKSWKDVFCGLLSALTGKDWAHGEINGHWQKSWNNIFYVRSACPYDIVKRIERLYFNTGSEWIVHSLAGHPKCAEDIEGYSVYCSDFDPMRFFCDKFHAKEEDIALYKFDGYVPKYSIQ